MVALTNSKKSAKIYLMSFSKIKGADGVIRVRIKTPEGKTYTFRENSTKPIDPKLKREADARSKSMREGFRKAVLKARERKVSLQTVVPVS